jgi:4'-phosphopantetheinyl transferase EntD
MTPASQNVVFEDWELFREKVLHDVPEQSRACKWMKAAFIAGQVSASLRLRALAGLSDQDGMKALDEYNHDLTEAATNPMGE